MNVLLHPRPATALTSIGQTTASSYLLYGPAGVGKTTAALELAHSLSASPEHPDLHMVRPEEKPSITIAQIRGLGRSLSLQPYYPTGLRMVIIDNADVMTTEAQNALLKQLEEPPPRTIFLLVAVRPEALLPTVRSRCAAVYFPPPSAESTVKWLVANAKVNPDRATELVAAAGNLPARALALASDTTAADAELEFTNLVAKVSAATRFDRLLLAARLVAGTNDLARFGQLVQARLIQEIRAGAISATAAARSLTAIEQFRRHTTAGLAPRVALERLMLEL